ncbi:DUF1223 domain-containing protein [Starkeya koreensis]|uniref:DUF1223 domain-containing protein n=1 Tax=Ancylobacter koreensis TaxID=266121 RepID=A0ABT0DH23_9HYPH|nr:DUF1223 domain-containing protein [Ancylobacter koreensis]MCK0206588.1 DUF1223 domain-containing protein [Ancylobacter koreensis]
MSVYAASARRPESRFAGHIAGRLPGSAPAALARCLGMLALVLVLPVAAQAGSPAGDDAAKPVAAVTAPKAMIELFTSQGCSSCPPADKLMSELAERPDVIALTLAVDYWDYLGWKDTLAKHGHSLRQKAYARMRGDGKMFTPQAVVNGRVMAIGSDRAMLERTVASISRPAVPVSVMAEGDRVRVKVGPAGGADSGEVWLCPVASRMKVDIGRGENEGTSMTYHNVVRGWVKLGDWTGDEARFEATLRRLPGDPTDSVVVFVQSGSSTEPGPILGAALEPLP